MKRSAAARLRQATFTPFARFHLPPGNVCPPRRVAMTIVRTDQLFRVEEIDLAPSIIRAVVASEAEADRAVDWSQVKTIGPLSVWLRPPAWRLSPVACGGEGGGQFGNLRFSQDRANRRTIEAERQNAFDMGAMIGGLKFHAVNVMRKAIGPVLARLIGDGRQKAGRDFHGCLRADEKAEILSVIGTQNADHSPMPDNPRSHVFLIFSDHSGVLSTGCGGVTVTDGNAAASRDSERH